MNVPPFADSISEGDVRWDKGTIVSSIFNLIFIRQQVSLLLNNFFIFSFFLKWTNENIYNIISAVGDSVKEDEEVCHIETDKTSIPVKAPFSGVITELCVEDGSTVQSGAKLFVMNSSGKKKKSLSCKIFTTTILFLYH